MKKLLPIPSLTELKKRYDLDIHEGYYHIVKEAYEKGEDLGFPCGYSPNHVIFVQGLLIRRAEKNIKIFCGSLDELMHPFIRDSLEYKFHH